MGKDRKNKSQNPVGSKIRSFIDVLDRPWDWFRFLGSKKSTNGALHKEELHIDYSSFWLEEEEERQKKKIERRIKEEEEIKNAYYRKLEETKKAEEARQNNVAVNKEKLKHFTTKLEHYIDRINKIEFDQQYS